MAGHLIRAGHEVWVWNRTASKMTPLIEQGARPAKTPKEVAENVEILMSCLGRTEDVRECLIDSENAAAFGAKPGALFVDHSTISPQGAEKMASELKAKGIDFVDAPVTGGSIGAQSGKLTIFLGGDNLAVNRAIDAIQPYTKSAANVGASGFGQRMKLANQIAVGGALIGLCECLAFAKKAGLDMDQAKAMIGSGAGGSWAFENYGPKILNRDWSPGFSIKNQRKDFGYCKEAAKELDAFVPCTELVDELLGKMESMGFGEETTAILFELLSGG